MQKNKKGFTLIEILVVVVIIGLLANMAAANFAGKTDEARKVAEKGSLINIKTALELYEMDKGSYPGDQGENPLQVLLGDASSTAYLKIDPEDLKDYKYTLSEDKKSYTIDIKEKD